MDLTRLVELPAAWLIGRHRRRHPEKLAQMRPMIGLVGRHPVTIGKLPMDFGMEVGKGGKENFVKLARPRLVGRAARLRRVVEEGKLGRK
jgi:hypothetical protein